MAPTLSSAGPLFQLAGCLPGTNSWGHSLGATGGGVTLSRALGAGIEWILLGICPRLREGWLQQRGAQFLLSCLVPGPSSQQGRGEFAPQSVQMGCSWAELGSSPTGDLPASALLGFGFSSECGTGPSGWASSCKPAGTVRGCTHSKTTREAAFILEGVPPRLGYVCNQPPGILGQWLCQLHTWG